MLDELREVWRLEIGDLNRRDRLGVKYREVTCRRMILGSLSLESPWRLIGVNTQSIWWRRAKPQLKNGGVDNHTAQPLLSSSLFDCFKDFQNQYFKIRGRERVTQLQTRLMNPEENDSISSERETYLLLGLAGSSAPQSLKVQRDEL